MTIDWEQLAAQREREIADLKRTIASLEAKVADLERRLNRNPRNSSMPPSAEGLTKPPVENRAAQGEEASRQATRCRETARVPRRPRPPWPFSVITDLLKDAPAVHFDETGARIEGSLHWIHVACTSLYTLLVAHKKRGTIAMDDIGLLAKMTGVAIHDGYKSYRTYDVVHQLCNAHHVRELDGVVDHFGQGWAEEMIDLLLDAKEAVEAAIAKGAKSLDKRTLHSIRVRYGKLISKGWAANEEPTAAAEGKWYKNTATNLLERLDAYRGVAHDCTKPSTRIRPFAPPLSW